MPSCPGCGVDLGWRGLRASPEDRRLNLRRSQYGKVLRCRHCDARLRVTAASQVLGIAVAAPLLLAVGLLVKPHLDRAGLAFALAAAAAAAWALWWRLLARVGRA